MVKAIVVICLLLLPVQLLIAQDEPVHPLSELKTLLPHSQPDTERVSLLPVKGNVPFVFTKALTN